jgi:hypothetical protein
MLQDYRLYDADAHAMMRPLMWETLPTEYAIRRPPPTRVADTSDMRRWTNGRYCGLHVGGELLKLLVGARKLAPLHALGPRIRLL